MWAATAERPNAPGAHPRRPKAGKAGKAPREWRPLHWSVVLPALGGVSLLLGLYVIHCIHTSADMYSSPSIVLQSSRP